METYAGHNILLLAQVLVFMGGSFATSNALGHLVMMTLRNLNSKELEGPHIKISMEITPLELGIAVASMSLQEHLHRVKVELFALQKGVHVEAMG